MAVKMKNGAPQGIMRQTQETRHSIKLLVRITRAVHCW
jgi:hypothetical protein